MASVWMLLLLKSFFMCGLSLDTKLIKVYPKQPILGVFQASLGNKYELNASAARDVCEHLGVTIASKAQVVEAQKHGLETCRFGWIDEQIAVVPRVQVKSNCGSGEVGVVAWRADVNTKFDVFCFNLIDFEIQNQAMTADQKSTEKPITTTPKASTSSPLSSFSIPPALSHNPNPNEIEVERHLPMSGTPASVGVVPVALLITVTFVALLAVFLALHFKMNRSCRMFRDAERRQEDIETEVWKHCSEKDLQKTQEENVQEKEEENDSNSSSSPDQD
ncbi:lymphatic vessel endothelial hyaluronic acid receptor 1a [Triplophysa rosa]|uniref:Lymphatic vessel endothelial hyaluronic acid receptor 1 n=1 Tax=Triplophysa rosa TaxID=992332 RepID=A0A9W7X489_TRIRA|nr:lymphatic vessel endothelial hyaluronic acid receptor 1a [Triplophysa rosa]KAI7814367.1 putative lymphatic vessel endothelial hyaluronic acid receptor 1 [Triplophysa rosa]